MYMQKISKIELQHSYEKCSFRWFTLLNCITVHGAKNLKYVYIVLSMHYDILTLGNTNECTFYNLCILSITYSLHVLVLLPSSGSLCQIVITT